MRVLFPAPAIVADEILSVCQLPGIFPDRRIQFEQLDRKQQGGERNLGLCESAPFPNTPLPPTAVAPVPLTADPAKKGAAAVRTRRARNQETVIPKLRFSGLFIMRVSSQVDK